MSFASLNNAIKNLREREGTPKEKIGYVNIPHKRHWSNNIESLANIIRNRAQKKVDSVIWTNSDQIFQANMAAA